MPDELDPFRDVRDYHPSRLDFSAVPDREFTPEERNRLIALAEQSRTTHEWLSAIAKVLGAAVRGMI